jgi:hypothetical protein
MMLMPRQFARTWGIPNLGHFLLQGCSSHLALCLASDMTQDNSAF